jgi:hypothetical protein
MGKNSHFLTCINSYIPDGYLIAQAKILCFLAGEMALSQWLCRAQEEFFQVDRLRAHLPTCQSEVA